MLAFVCLKKIICGNGPRNSFQTRCFKFSAVIENESNAKKAIDEKNSTTKSSELLFNSESKNNQKAENISREMAYYLKNLNERGNYS